jgi:protein TonB
MKNRKYLKKAFWFSLVVHAAVLLVMLATMRNAPPAQKRAMDIDFAMKKMAETPPPEPEPEEPPEPAKPQELPKNALAPKTPGAPKPVAAAPPQGPQTQADSGVAVDAPENSGKSPFLGGGGWGDGTGDGEAGDLTEYVKGQFDYIRTIVLQHMQYPEEAQSRGIEGRVLISFIVMSDGTVKDIKVVTSSGYAILDKNAIETVKNSAPFPKPPGNAELRIPINYVLET